MVDHKSMSDVGKITHHVPRFDFCGSSNTERRSMAVSLAFAPWEHDPARTETRPVGRTIRTGSPPTQRPLAGAALTSSLKRIIREVAQEMENE